MRLSLRLWVCSLSLLVSALVLSSFVVAKTQSKTTRKSSASATKPKATPRPKATPVPQFQPPKEYLRVISVSKSTARAESKAEGFTLQQKAPIAGRLAVTYPINSVKHKGTEFPSRFGLQIHQWNDAPDAAFDNASTHSVTTYVIENLLSYLPYYEIYKPLFSPDGRYILLKYGDRQGAASQGFLFYYYGLVVFDLQSQKFTNLNSRLSNPYVSWSPDSEYIAYIYGGDANGNTTFALFHEVENLGPLSLHIQHWRTGKEYLITKSDLLKNQVSWLAPHTLLFSMLPEAHQKLHTGESKTHPNIYRFAPGTGSPQLVMADGYLLYASPDNQWMAFYGSENPDKPWPLKNSWYYEAGGLSLSVARVDGTKRQALNRQWSAYSSLQWLPDGESLIEVRGIKESPAAQAEITLWDINSGTAKRLAVLSAKDAEKIETNDKFRPTGLSADKKSFLIWTTEWIANNKKDVTPQRKLYAINIEDGSTKLLLQIQGNTGESWLNQ